MAVSVKPPAIQGDVIALFGQGVSKRSIARQLSIDRATVDRILKAYSQNKPVSASRLQQIIPKAYDAVDKAVTSGDARIAMDLLKLELGQRSANVYHVHGDAHLSQAVNMLAVPAPSGTTSTPITAGSTGTEQPIEAAAKAAPTSLDLSCHEDFSRNRTNFSQFSDAELEAELARRRAARASSTVVDAEVVR